MSIKQTAQLSLADGIAHRSKHICALDSIHDAVDWQQIDTLLNAIEIRDTGNSAYPALMMFKILFLQTWHNLSDSKMEQQIARDLLFRRFIGMPADLAGPDHATIWRFREKLVKLDLMNALFDNVKQQLHDKRLMMKRGNIAIIDATVVQSASKHDKDGEWTSKKNSQGKVTSTHGYKVHAKSDEDGFVRRAVMTPANTHDSRVFRCLLEATEDVAVSADAAYPSEENENTLEQMGIENRMHERAYRNKPLTEQQKQNNRLRSTNRNTIERVFAHTKLQYGIGRMRYSGIARNLVRITMAFICHNLKTARRLWETDMPQSV